MPPLSETRRATAEFIRHARTLHPLRILPPALERRACKRAVEPLPVSKICILRNGGVERIDKRLGPGSPGESVDAGLLGAASGELDEHREILPGHGCAGVPVRRASVGPAQFAERRRRIGLPGLEDAAGMALVVYDKNADAGTEARKQPDDVGIPRQPVVQTPVLAQTADAPAMPRNVQHEQISGFQHGSQFFDGIFTIYAVLTANYSFIGAMFADIINTAIITLFLNLL